MDQNGLVGSVSHPSLNDLEPAALRAFALDAYRRAEAGERQAKVEARRAHAEAQRAHAEAQRVAALSVKNAALLDRVAELTTTNDTLTAKADALTSEVDVLLKRITELTKQLAQATDRDRQLALDLELRHLQEQLAALNTEKFGTKSERRDKNEDAKKDKKKPKEKKGHGPTPQPKLPVVEVVHHLDDADCSCPQCGEDLRIMANQFQTSELISVVQVRYVVKLHKQQKYRCKACDHIDTALGPFKLIPGGRYDLAFAVQVALDKYLDALPLERQVQRMKRRQLTVTSQTLWDQLVALYYLLLPTFIALRQQVLGEPILHADETSWRVMGKGGKGRSAKWWLWVLSGHKGVVFDIQPSRGSAAAKHVLQGFAGVLVADGYGVYASLEKAIEKQGGLNIDLQTGELEVLPNFSLAGCWMHARRPFFKTAVSAPESDRVLDLIGKLYEIEARAREAAGDDIEKLVVERRRLRESESVGVIEEIKLWRDAQRPLPGSKFAKGITFLKNQWGPLTKFLTEPRIPIDNGEAERMIRGPVVGRKNFGGSQTEKGTRIASLFYSLLLSAKQVGIDPHAYLMEVARRALANRGTVLLPTDYAAELVEAA